MTTANQNTPFPPRKQTPPFTPSTSPQARLEALASATGRPIRDGQLRMPCPVHHGQDDNLVVSVGRDRLLAYCHSADCSYEDIAGAIEAAHGVSIRPTPRSQSVETGRWDYINTHGQTMWVVRLDGPAGKKIHREPTGLRGPWLVRLFRPAGGGGGDGPVVLCEGEKAAGAVAASGLEAASYQGGYKVAGRAIYTPLAGREVVIWADDDTPGRQAAADAARALDGVASTIRVVDMPGKETKKDAADFPNDAIRQMVADAKPWTMTAEATAQVATSAPHTTDTLKYPEYFQIADWYSREYLKGTFRFVTEAQTWWHYDGLRWTPLPTDDRRLMDHITINRIQLAARLEREVSRALAEVLADPKAYRAQKYQDSDLWAAFRNILAGKEPTPEDYLLGTPTGIVDLRSGRLIPHAPEHNIRAITTGRYLPDDGVAHLQALQSRFSRVLSEEALRELLRLVGLAMTHRAQSYRAVVMLIGPSGSGKGGAVNVVAIALGEYAHGVDAAWLQNKGHNTDIDSTTATILERQPVVLAVDEIGGDTKIGVSRFLTATGNAPITARHPHSKPLHGRPVFQLWTTAVEPPEFPVGAGLRRRLAVLPTLRELAAGEIDVDGGEDPALMDAIITLGAREAQLVYQPGYEAPAGDAAARANVLRNMDEVADWLEALSIEWNNHPVAEVLEAAREQLEMPDLSSTGLGRKIGLSTRWEKAKLNGTRVMRLKAQEQERLI